MKRLLPFLFAIVLVLVAVIPNTRQTSSLLITNVGDFLLKDTKPAQVSQFAWQVQPPTEAIEDTTHISWWWWVLGVVIVIGAGMLLYVLMKKDPRQDAR